MSDKKKKTKFPNRKDDKYFPDQEKAPSPDEGPTGKDPLDKAKAVAHKVADKMIEAKAAGVPTPTVAPDAVTPPPAIPAAPAMPPAMPVAPRQMPMMKKGGSVKAAASRVKSSASRRADGAAQRGKTKGRTV
jgi:hypothetical protein